MLRLPGCNDTGQPTAPPDELVKVARLPDVDPDVAVVDAAAPEVIYVRSDLDPLPAAVARFFDAPSCRQEDSPIELKGQWLGIIGPGEQTELDLVPPYSVEMFVSHSSSRRYVNAEINIDVPPSLGSPLTREDGETSLSGGEAGSSSDRCATGNASSREASRRFPSSQRRVAYAIDPWHLTRAATTHSGCASPP
jgi:hypothetical protein